MSSNRIEDELGKIREYIDTGALEIAESALGELEHRSIPDEHQTDFILVRSSYFLENKHPNKAKDIINPLFSSLDKLPKLKQIQLLTIDAKIMVNNSDFVKAEKQIEKIESMIEDVSNDADNKLQQIIPDLKNLKGLIYSSKGDYQEALKLFEEASMQYRKQDRVKQRGTAQFNHGRVLGMLGKHERAIAVLEEAVKIFKDIAQVESLASTYDQLIRLNEEIDDRDGVFTYKQLKQDLKDKLAFERYKIQAIKEKDELSSKLSKANQKIQELKQENFNLKFELNSSSTSDEKSLPDEINRKKIENYDKLVQQNNELKVKVENKEREIEELTEEIDTYELEVAQNVDLNQNLDEVKQKNEILQTDNEELKEIIGTLQNKIDNLQNKPPDSEVDERINELEDKLEDKEKRISELSEAKQNLEREIEDLKNMGQNSNLTDNEKSKLKELETENEQLKQQLQEIRDNLPGKQNIIKMSEKLNKLTDEKEQLEDELVEQRRKVNQQILKISDLEKQNKSLKDKQGVIDSNITSEVDRLREKNTELVQELEEKDLRIRRLELELDQMQTFEEEPTVKEEIQPEKQSKTISPIPTPPGMDTQPDRPEPQSDIVRGSLDELIASDKLIEKIYNRLKRSGQTKVRLLAMQLGISQDACKRALEQLADFGAVVYDSDSSNPEVFVK